MLCCCCCSVVGLVTPWFDGNEPEHQWPVNTTQRKKKIKIMQKKQTPATTLEKMLVIYQPTGIIINKNR